MESKDVVELTTKTKGVWQATINADKKHKITCSAIGYKILEKTIDANPDKEIELLLEPMKVGENFIMRSIYFLSQIRMRLKKNRKRSLKKLLEYLIENPTVGIEIQGHTNGDNRIYKNKDFKELGDEWNFKGSSKKLSATELMLLKSI